MISEDPFSQSYAELLSGTYDVVDRLVLNAYFPVGQYGGGFRSWWRQLHGDDEALDNAHLMRMAGRFARRVRGWAEKNHVPVVNCVAGERKSEVATEYLPTDESFRGIFAVLVGRAPAPVWDVDRFGNGGIGLKRKKPFPWVNHYSFHILDGEWGHVTVKLCGHPPFTGQVLLNGHEYVACQARRAGISFAKEGNCFTAVSNARGLARVADTLRSATAIGRLRQVCERWVYTCLAFGLSLDEQELSSFHYSYSVYQAEYSRNLLFHCGGQMEEVFQRVIDHTRASLDVRTIKTVFGFKVRPSTRSKNPRCEVAVERPMYDLTIFKVHFRRLTLKIYTKGERVLRIEAIAHNTKDLRCGKSLERFPEIVNKLAAMVNRFLSILRCIGAAWIADGTLDDLSKPSQVGKVRVGGINVNQPRIRAVMAAVIALAPSPLGFSASELAERVGLRFSGPYGSRQAAYDLKKMRGKAWVVATAKGARRYQATSNGLRAMAALQTLRDKVIQPLLSGGQKRIARNRSTVCTPIDHHYEIIRREMRSLFHTLGIAA